MTALLIALTLWGAVALAVAGLYHHSRTRPAGPRRHRVTLTTRPVPDEYAAVYRRRGLQPPLGHSGHDRAALWPYEPRERHRAYARRHGYFWLPCPLCDRGFGGHEITEYIHFPDQESHSRRGICPWCTSERNGGMP